MSECVTHHHACECREARFAALEAVAEAVERLRHPMTGEEFQTALRDARLAKARLDAVTGGETS